MNAPRPPDAVSGTPRPFTGLPSWGRRQGRTKEARVAPPDYPLENGESKALARLRVENKFTMSQKGFERAVKVYLAAISVTRGMKGWPKAPSTRAREKVQRRLRSVKTWIRSLEKPFDVSLDGLHLPEPPLQELRDYAYRLELRSDLFLSFRASSGKRRTPKRKPDQATGYIRELVEFITQHTGSPHWGSVTTLLRRAYGDRNYTADRLRNLCRYYRGDKTLSHGAQLYSRRYATS